jgi:Zn finger protein HypA/HybF involved in hydrogenase expression
MFYNCFNCHKVSPLSETAEKKCPLCGSANGEALTSDRFEESLKAGVFFNIDAKTGKRAKNRR